MGSLLLFPWLEIKTPLDVGIVHLVPYRRGRLPGGPSQAAIDTLTEPYLMTRKSPIINACLMRYGSDVLSDVSDNELQEVFELGSVVTTAGLSARRFFGIGYWNRDNFHFLSQRFEDPARGAFFETRRLDGSTGIYVPHDNLAVSRPIHAGSGGPAEFDESLLAALLTAREVDDWPRLREAIQVFNLASTDDPDIPVEVAIVLMNGAIEQVLGSKSKSGDIVTRLETALSPRDQRLLSDCAERVAKLPAGRQAVGSMRAAWMRDFFALRGDLAHGRLNAKYQGAWTPREHLLMASFCFPLLLKQELKSMGLYSMTEYDQDCIDAFEALCCVDFFRTGSFDVDDDEDAPSWNRIMAEAGLARIVEKWTRQLEDLEQGADGPTDGVNGV